MAIKNKLDNRQARQRVALDQISSETDLRLDTILNLINDELTPPLRITTNGIKTINIGSNTIQTQYDEPVSSGSGTVSKGHGRKKVLPPISDTIPSFTSGYITIPSTSGGSILSDKFQSGVTYTLNISSGYYRKMMISLTKDGYLSLTFGQEASTEAAATNPVSISETIPVGIVVLRNTSGTTIGNVSNDNIMQFAGSSVAGYIPNTVKIKQTSHGFVVGDVLYLNSSTYTKAIATDTVYESSNVLGIVSKIIDVDNFELTTDGKVTISTASFSSGSRYFLSDISAGSMTTTAPNTVGSIKVEVGTAISSTEFLISPKLGLTVGQNNLLPNVRTQIALSGSASVISNTAIQSVGAYDAGELAGWVYLDAATDYRFYVKIQFAKKADGTYSVSTVQTAGDTPPVGFAMSVSGSYMQITLPTMTGWVSGYIVYSLNAPAAGTSFPLAINASNVNSNYREVTSAYTATSSDYTVVGSGSSSYAITLPSVTGSGISYVIKSNMDVGVGLTLNTTNNQLIDYITAKELAPGEVIKVTSSGSKWIIVENNKNNYYYSAIFSDYSLESTYLVGSFKFEDTQTTLNLDFWSGTGPLNTARNNSGGAGTQSASLIFGGRGGPSPFYTGTAEKFNGSAWSTAGGLTARQELGGCGIQNSALAFGGYTSTYVPTVEKFNGSTWTSTGSLLTIKSTCGSSGTQNAALAFGGYDSSSNILSNSEKFNGSTWSTTGSLATARQYLAGAGTQNAALAFGGYPNISTTTSITEKFNGSVWSSTGSLSANKAGLSSAGTQNATLAAGGTTTGSDRLAVAEKFNGNTWTTTGNLILGVVGASGAGSQNAALTLGGSAITIGIVATVQKFHGQLQHGFQGVYKGANKFIEAQNTQSSLSMNLELDYPSMLQIDTAFDTNGGLSSSERLDITELGREDYQSGEWSTSSYMNTARYALAGSGTQNAALAFGGWSGTILTITGATEKFNGTTWGTTGSLNTIRYYLAGAGVQNAALAFGGSPDSGSPYSQITEKFNGSIWSQSTPSNLWNMIIGRWSLTGVGVQNAALAFGGWSGITTRQPASEKFNGNTWFSIGVLNSPRDGLSGSGSQNAALAFGGASSPTYYYAEKFNGSTWTTTGVLAFRQGSAGSGTQNATLAFGGDDGSSNIGPTEKFNGSTWSTTGSLGIARSRLAGSGTQNAALASGGYASSSSTVTEKFNYNIQFIPNTRQDGLWSATGALSARSFLAGSGSQNAALAFGGSTGGVVGTTEKFNGSTWSQGSIPQSGTGALTARHLLAGAGTQNAALAFGGSTGSDYLPTTEKFNGSTWSNANPTTNMVARYSLAGAGTQNAALAFGGIAASLTITSVTEKFNGSTWSTGPTTAPIPQSGAGSLTARYRLAGVGTQNAALAFGGNIPPASPVTEKFNGSTWSTTGSLVTARSFLAGSGSQNAALAFGGFTGSATVGTTEKFNGSTWSQGSIPQSGTGALTARYGLAGAGTQNAALAFGGTTGSSSFPVTEKYNETLNGYMQYTQTL